MQKNFRPHIWFQLFNFYTPGYFLEQLTVISPFQKWQPSLIVGGTIVYIYYTILYKQEIDAETFQTAHPISISLFLYACVFPREANCDFTFPKNVGLH